MRRIKICIACGGSGGHIFPAIALAQELKEKNSAADILFIGSANPLDKRIFEKEGAGYELLSSNKLPYKKSLKSVLFFIKLFFDFVKSFVILIRFKPDVAVGFGGYVSSPVILVAYILRIPSIIHEQNVVPGRANRALFRFVRKIAISFEETAGYLGKWTYKKVFTGNPIRTASLKDDRSANLKKLGLSTAKFTILVIGGSQGAHNLNQAFIAGITGLDDSMRSRLQIIHITGAADYSAAEEAYKKLNIEYRVFSFIDRIEEAYSASDLVVTRSGASAVFEVAYFGRPMILVPYPFAMSHQAENARFFSRNGAAVQIDEKELSPDKMKEKIIYLSGNSTVLKNMAESAKRLSKPDSSRNLANEVLMATQEMSK